MNNRRGRLHRRLWVEHRLPFFVFHVDEIHRFFGGMLVIRRDRGDFLADEADEAVGEDRHVVEFPPDLEAGHVFSGEDRVNAGQLQCADGVDALDAPEGNRAAQNFAPEHSGQSHVHGVDRFAGYFVFALDSRRRIAYDFFLRHYPTSSVRGLIGLAPLRERISNSL